MAHRSLTEEEESLPENETLQMRRDREREQRRQARLAGTLPGESQDEYSARLAEERRVGGIRSEIAARWADPVLTRVTDQVGRVPFSPIGKKMPKGTLRTVVDAFYEERRGGPRILEDLRSGLTETARRDRQRLAHLVARQARLWETIEEAGASDKEISEFAKISEELAAAAQRQAEIAQSSIAASPGAQHARKRMEYLKAWRHGLHDALVTVAPTVDVLQDDLGGGTLTVRGLHEMVSVAEHVLPVARAVGENLGRLVEAESAEMGAIERGRLVEARDYLHLAEHSLTSVRSFVRWVDLERKEDRAQISNDEIAEILVLREVLMAAPMSPRTADDEDDERDLVVDEHNAFKALEGGLRGVRRAWDRMASATAYATSDVAKRESGEMTPNGRFPRCTSM